MVEYFISGVEAYGIAIDHLRVKDPVEQIILVFEMVIETFAVHITPLTDMCHLYFVKGDLIHEFPQSGCKRPFCNVGISHDFPYFQSLAHNPKMHDQNIQMHYKQDDAARQFCEWVAYI